jgi:hypothetical protein
MIKLTGIIENVFDGMTVFRGYATLRTLMKLSKPGEYQRKEDSERLPKIGDFLRESPFKFFPELIFGWQMEDETALPKIKGGQESGTISLTNKLKIKKAKFKFQDALGENPTTKVISMEITDEIVKSQPLNRLDGNHRLCALSNIMEEEKNYGTPNPQLNMIVPFSILIQTKNNEADKYESAFFYLINSKAKALTTEENLKSIFSNETFTSTEKEHLLDIDNSQMSIVEEYIKLFKSQEYEFVTDVFNKEVYTLSLDLVKLITSTNFTKITTDIQYLNSLYKDKVIDIQNHNIFIALIKVKTEEEMKYFESFLYWIKSYDLIKIKGISPQEVIILYKKTKEQIVKIFVAMPFFEKDTDIVADYNRIYKNAIDEVNETSIRPISLYPIMCQMGATQDQIQDILKKIRDCDIFFADITGNNANVTYEMGWARALNKRVIIVKRNGPPEPNSDYKNDTYHEYNDSCRATSLHQVIKENLLEVLKSDSMLKP